LPIFQPVRVGSYRILEHAEDQGNTHAQQQPHHKARQRTKNQTQDTGYGRPETSNTRTSDAGSFVPHFCLHARIPSVVLNLYFHGAAIIDE
jgi:hypothetical protein